MKTLISVGKYKANLCNMLGLDLADVDADMLAVSRGKKKAEDVDYPHVGEMIRKHAERFRKQMQERKAGTTEKEDDCPDCRISIAELEKAITKPVTRCGCKKPSQ